MADAHQAAAVGRDRGQLSRRSGARATASMKALAVHLIRRGQRLHHLRERGVVAVAERDGDGELAGSRDVDLAHHGDVAVERLAEAARSSSCRCTGPESRRWCRHSRRLGGVKPQSAPKASEMSFFHASRHALARDIDRARGIARAAAVEMRRQQRVALQPRQDRFVAVDLHVHQHHRMVRVGDELLGTV